MTAVVLGMLLALTLALAVVGLVAVPARRQGRDVLTPQTGQQPSSPDAARDGQPVE